MAQNIAQFYRKAQSNDFARIFQFRVKSFANIITSEEDFLYLETANLPGRAINSVAVPYMGLQFNVPGTASYPGSDNYAVKFRCDAGYNLRALLENATRNVFDDQTSTGNYAIPGQGSNIVLELYTGGVQAQTGTAQAFANSSTIEEPTTRTYVLYGAWIKSLGDVSYDIKDNGTVATIDAVMCYQYWTAAGVLPPAPTQDLQLGISLGLQ